MDRHMVCNVRLRACRRKLELETDNVVVLAHHFDTSFIKDYKFNSDNYSKSELFHLVSFMLVVFDNLINFFCIIIDYRITLYSKLLCLYQCCL